MLSIAMARAYPAPRGARDDVRCLRHRSQQTFGCLAASQERIEQSRRVMLASHAALVRTHVLGVRYADWRLRRDVATVPIRPVNGSILSAKEKSMPRPSRSVAP
jgi:hypothetical protein